MEKKKKIILIIIISLLVILVLGLGGYIIYDKVINENETSKNTTTVETKYVFKRHSTDTLNKCFSNLSSEEGGDCTEAIKTSSGEHILKLHVLPDSSPDGPVPILYIDNKKVLEFDIAIFGGIDEIYTIDDDIIFNTNNGYYSYIFSLRRNKLEEITNFDKEIPEMRFMHSTKTIKNKIYFEGYRLSQQWFAVRVAGYEVTVCDKEERQKYGVNEDTIISGLYEMEYLGQDKYIITRVQEETIGEFIRYSSIDDYCEYEGQMDND